MPAHKPTAITIRGPFWDADALVLEGSVGQGQALSTAAHYRSIFVEANPQSIPGGAIHLPGTVLTLVHIREVRINPPSGAVLWQRVPGTLPAVNTDTQIRSAINNGSASLLLLQTQPEETANDSPVYTCVGGEILIDTPAALNALWEKCLIEDVDQCRVHGSGVSIHGMVSAPWENDRLAAWLLLSVDFPHAGDREKDIYQLNFEHERMVDEELRCLRQAWQNLSRIINPRHPRNDLTDLPDSVQIPTWVTLEITDPLAAPHFYWIFSDWSTGPVKSLHFRTDEVAILLADQQPYPGLEEAPVTSLAHVVPQTIEIKQNGNNLVITLEIGDMSDPAVTENLNYIWDRAKQVERMTSDQLKVAYDHVKVADFLRRTQNRLAPVLPRDEDGNMFGRPCRDEPNDPCRNFSGGLVKPPLIWGFMPLEDGWAQLPFLNLTEQIYIDLDLAKPLPDANNRPPTIMNGALSLGNDHPTVLAGYCDEQPWNMTLVNARRIEGKWAIHATAQGYELGHVSLTVSGPDLYLNGLFWLSTGAPTVEDALPDLNSGLSAARSVTLRTLDQIDDVFPPLIHLVLSNLAFNLRPTVKSLCREEVTAEIAQASADLETLNMHYAIDQEIFAKLTAVADEDNNRILPALPIDTFSQHLPLIWRRHPRLPMIQALPLTQNRHTPNFPNASRQLVPYALLTDDEQRPSPDWRFSLSGANSWPRHQGQMVVAPEWSGLFDLPLVALSLPGLELDPKPGLGLGLQPGDESFPHLATQLRFDLPYLDQVNALAQLPKALHRPAETSPLPEARPAETPKPLQRETYSDYWRELSEKASLARADAVDVIDAKGPAPVVANLIEPWQWPVTLDLRLNDYPGAISITNATGDDTELLQTGASALRGFDGSFEVQSDGTLHRASAANGGYQLTAGTMDAHPEEGGAYRDQRGLLRYAAAIAGDGLIKTRVHFLDGQQDKAFELTSVRRPIRLSVNDTVWTTFWVRDLPVESDTQTFDWQSTRSAEAIDKETDINDPNAQSRSNNFLTSYQWHLDHELVLGGLHFHPLVLEKVLLSDDTIRRIEVIGRLQLPIDGYHELTDLSNAVRLTFERQPDQVVALTAVEPVGDDEDGAQGEWPLALQNGEMTAAPLLTWQQITLNESRDALEVSDAALRFFLFDVPWLVKLDKPLVFPLGSIEQVSIDHTFIMNEAAAFVPHTLRLALQLPEAQRTTEEGEAFKPHECDLTMQVILGDRQVSAFSSRAAFYTHVVFSLVAGDKPTCQDSILFNDLLLQAVELQHKDNMLQFGWKKCVSRAELEAAVELLPGMPLAATLDPNGQAMEINSPGFAIMQFSGKVNAEVPTFDLQMGFIEVLLNCSWGEYLSEATRANTISENTQGLQSAAFGSSAGDLVFAYTSSLHANEDGSPQWDETFLLNGFVEIKNIISWPQDLHYDQEEGKLKLPRALSGNLNHRRHSLRILFNQHEIPPDLPLIGKDHLLFQFADRPWQFLAVVEHQIACLDANDGGLALIGQQRWAVVQEVRFQTTATFNKWLKTDRVFYPVSEGETHSLTVSIQKSEDDINQIIKLKPDGSVDSIRVFNDPSGDITDPVPRGAHWIGNKDFMTKVESYTGFRFVVKGIPRGAKINEANFSVRPVPASIPGNPVKFTLFVENSVNRSGFSETHPIMRGSDHLLTKDHLQNIELTSEWGHRLEVLGDLGELVQQLVNRADWNQDEAVVTIVIQGTGDKEFWVRKGFGTTPTLESDIFRYITGGPSPIAGRSSALDIRYSVSECASTFGLFTEKLRPMIIQELDALSDQPMLFVEASAPFWLRRDAVVTPTMTALQYLPNGTQFAAQSNPSDFAPVNPGDAPNWQLLIMPFLGRLQSAGLDDTGESPLQVDPVRLIEQRLMNGDPLPALALALSNQGGSGDVEFDVSGFESLATRSVARLDISTLQENWLRLQVLIPEEEPASLRSVIAALPNTMARLSRDIALRRLFDSRREHYPPRVPSQTGENRYHVPSPVDDPMLIWREASLLVAQGVSKPRQDDNDFYGWHIPGLQIHELAADLEDGHSSHYPAATIIPAWNTPGDTLPFSFAVSPYLSLVFRAAVSQESDEVALELYELLAIEPTLKRLRPISSLLREEVIADDDSISTWAEEMLRRFAPESPVAVIRIRQVVRATAIDNANESLVSTRYSYRLIDTPRSGRMARRTTRMRSDIKRLHFRQGQFSPYPMADDLKAFEIAPPQTIGAQAIYLTEAPNRITDAAIGRPDWPWGYSALRLAVQYTCDKQGIAGEAHHSTQNPTRLLLWWQSLQFNVQFRPAGGDSRPAASLPAYFRGPAIRSLLPVNPTPPMPDLAPDRVTMVEVSTTDTPTPPYERWQPVLPGRLRYLVVGTRPGVPYVFRHSLLRQGWGESESSTSLIVSGSVPAQHRAPRPVPLPKNRPAGQAFALQPWASYFEPEVNARLTVSPYDETFEAECGPDPARRVQIWLLDPAFGLISARWKGVFRLQIDWMPELVSEEVWKLTCTLVGDGMNISLKEEHFQNAQSNEHHLSLTKPGEYVICLQNVEDIQRIVGGPLQLQIQIERLERDGAGNQSGFYQVVSLPLHYESDETLRLPLQPLFVHFEDPEYNRQLGSAAAAAASIFAMEETNGEVVSHEIRLSLDRKAYNPTSEMAFRYDWDNPSVIKAPDVASLALLHISASGASVVLKSWGGDEAIRNGQLKIIKLPDIVAKAAESSTVILRPGDRLELRATLPDNKAIGVELDVVEAPTIPSPEAAYTLLRRRPDGAVEAARFAWNPEATRVELICAEDLRGGFVRRRAVFHWRDAVRPNATIRHAVQKIAANGSTHWPDFLETVGE
jgi:hypothetical protein